MSLRTRLSLLLVGVAVVALVAANVAVYTVVSRDLDRRLDDRVRALGGPTVGFLRGEGAVSVGPRGFRFDALDLSDAWLELRDSSGNVLAARYLLGSGDREPPVVPETVFTSPGERLVDTSAGDVPYRMRIAALRDGSVLITALPADDERATKQRLLLIELLASAAVLAGTLGMAWVLVGVGLRPLARIEETAGRIATGDLSERVEPAGERTEIERLGRSLNTMLDEIETAFAAQTDSERRLRRFVADASHDLRTPLTSIRGYAELLGRDGGVDEATRETALRRIGDESQRLARLVEDLLLLARLDESAPLELERVDLGRLVHDLVTDARIAAPDREIGLVTEPVTADLDRHRLARAVTNVLANAITHTPPGTPIEVSVGREGGVAVIRVVDHGPGVAPEDAAHLFDRFWRADPSRSSTSGGTGLGLAITSAVVSAHGGRCEIVPTDGGGATFRLTLPLARPPVEA